MNNKGFIATSLVYSFFLVFVAVVASIIVTYAHNRILINNLNDGIVDDLNENILGKYGDIFNVLQNGDFETNEFWTLTNADIVTGGSHMLGNIVANNGLFWNASNGKCSVGANNKLVDCSFNTTGLKNSSTREMIERVRWSLGTGIATTPSQFYTVETLGSSPLWTGEVGLINVSDLGYATSGGVGVTKAQCLSTNVSSWSNECIKNSWLFYSDSNASSLGTIKEEWLLNKASENSYVYTKDNSGKVITAKVADPKNVRPVVYLKDSIKLVSGDGTYNNPYTIKGVGLTTPLTQAISNAAGTTDDGTSNHNLRYTGSNPNNYIYFNCSDYSNPTASTCERWRIIGVFKNVTIEDGNKTDLVKIVKNESIGTYSWDNKDTSSGAHSDNGDNDWSNAELMYLLNKENFVTAYHGYKSLKINEGDSKIIQNIETPLEKDHYYYLRLYAFRNGLATGKDVVSLNSINGAGSTVIHDFEVDYVKEEYGNDDPLYINWEMFSGIFKVNATGLYQLSIVNNNVILKTSFNTLDGVWENVYNLSLDSVMFVDITNILESDVDEGIINDVIKPYMDELDYFEGAKSVAKP